MTRRRSKVRSKTRSDSSPRSEDEILYCICRSSDGTRFMIACDNCEEWYHGDCINVTPKQANNIKRFFCHLCIGRNPNLEIEYKTSKEIRPRLPNLRQQLKKTNFSSDDENDADLSSSSSPDKSLVSNKSKRAMKKRWRPSISESVGKKRRGRPKERQDDYDEEATEDEIETSGFVPTMTDCVEEVDDNVYCSSEYRRTGSVARISSRRPAMEVERNSIPIKTANRPSMDARYAQDSGNLCGNCDGCKATNDCGRCDVCQRFGSSAMSRNVCRKRRCLRLEYRGQQKKTYHIEKGYENIVDDEFEAVVEEPEYHWHGNLRRRNDLEMDDIRQRLNHPLGSPKDTCAVGSKMRRGDHLPGGGNSTVHRRSLPNPGMPYKCHQEEAAEVTRAPYRYQQGAPANSRLSRHQSSQPAGQAARRARNQSDAAQMSSNTSSASGPMSSQQYHQYADESDEDVMIPGELIPPTNGTQRQHDPDHRNISNYHQLRPGKANVNSDTRNYHYGLNYPDHLYCKHHRSFDWHGPSPGEGGLCAPECSLQPGEPETCLRSPPSLETLAHPSPGSFLAGERAQRPGRPQTHRAKVGIPEGEGCPVPAPEPVKSSLARASLATPATAVFLKASLAAPAQPQEFYTINDEDDLEINWPKETVNV